MKSIKTGALLLMLFVSSTVWAQDFVLVGPWKVKFEDKKEFSRMDLDDSGWETLAELKWSDDHRTTANRTLWIRKKVVIPASLKSAFNKTGLLSLSMGKVLQSDDTYLNGKKIGSTGSGDTYRNYPVTENDILWDQENIIALRVSHWGQFRMSIIPKLTAAAPEHFLGYSTAFGNSTPKDQVAGKELTYQFIVNNASPKHSDGIVTADFYDFDKKKLHSEQKAVSIGDGKNTVNFVYTSPSPFVAVVYTLSIPTYNYVRKWNAQAGYENVTYDAGLPVVPYKVPQQFSPPDVAGSEIGGWLGEKLKANTELRLKRVDEEALLAGFINRPGNHSWIGEHIGKFLEAASNAYADNRDPALKIQLDRSAQHLIAAQLPDGYLGTYDMDSHWTSWDVWSHRYDLMGLLRYYEISGYRPALAASQKIGDLLLKTFGPGKGQKDIIRSGAHVGMAATSILESMAELYRFSGKKEYLDFCYYIVNAYNNPGGPRIISTLDSVGRVDKVANGKAYEMLSNILGILKLYRITGNETFLKPVLAAWNDVAQKRLYITGTSSSFEHFQDDQVLPGERTSNMGEGCVTTTWLQLSYGLLCLTGEMKYVDELERSLYNHLTGAENPQTGCVSYYTPLMGSKPFGCNITCCMSSVPRGIAMAPFFTGGLLNKAPAFFFYEPGTFSVPLANKTMANFTTTTAFPADGNITITANVSSAKAYSVHFRKPWWATDFALTVNGRTQPATPGQSLTVTRAWKKGDKVQISFSMPLITHHGGKSYPGQVAFQRGPNVLAFDEKINGFPVAEVTVDKKGTVIKKISPVFPQNWVGGQAVEIKSEKEKTGQNIILVPYADASQTGGAISTWLKTANN
ncbi:glycoside hydrolase family 127 protein [Flavitalea antarctica]